MRTTLDIDDELHQIARQRAFDERRSLGEVVSELMRRGLEVELVEPPRRPLGMFKGQITIADDFDEMPAEVTNAVDIPIS